MIIALSILAASIHTTSPAELLKRVAKSYASLQSYRDQVQVYGYPTSHQALIGKATIDVKKPKQFSMVLWRYDLDEKTTIKQDRLGHVRTTKVRLRRRRPIANASDLDAAPAEVTIPYEVVGGVLNGSIGPLDRSDWEVVTSEKLDGRPTYRLYSKEQYRVEYAWIDAKTYLIVKMRSKGGKKFEHDDTYVFHPRPVWRRG